MSKHPVWLLFGVGCGVVIGRMALNFDPVHRFAGDIARRLDPELAAQQAADAAEFEGIPFE